MGERTTGIRQTKLLALLAAVALTTEVACVSVNAVQAPSYNSSLHEAQAGRIGKLSSRLSSDIIRNFDLGKLANIPVTVYSINTDKPTYIYQYDPSVRVDSDAAKAIYDTTNTRNLPDLIEALRQNREPFDLQLGDQNPLRYEYAGRENLPIGVGIFSSNQVARERHLLIIGDDLRPNWTGDQGALTYNINTGPAGPNSQVQISVINIEKTVILKIGMKGQAQ